MILIMQKWTEQIEYNFDNRLMNEVFHEKAIFFDIETTGFSPQSTQLYLIGLAYREGSAVVIEQFFAENRDDEPEVLQSFFAILKHFDTIISFNGIGFDIPYLKGKCQRHKLSDPFDDKKYVDIFKIVSGLKFLLKLPSYRQKSIETFLDIEREDTFDGGELIDVYKEYVGHPTQEGLFFLKQHNYEDVLGMLDLIPMISYARLFEGKYDITDFSCNEYRGSDGSSKKELLFSIKCHYPIPKRVSYGFEDFYLLCNGDTAKLSIRLYDGTLKFFYENPAEYFYLPDEDMAIHKSVAGFVDKTHRIKATKSTCYSKKNSIFVPQFEELSTPVFKEQFKDKRTFFELNEAFVSSEEALQKYVQHVLTLMHKQKK